MTKMIKVKAKLQNLAKIHNFVKTHASVIGMDPDAIYDLRLAIEEAVTNIVNHGYQGMDGYIEVEISGEDNYFVLRLRDNASPFDPTQVSAPDLSESLFTRDSGGAGILLMEQSVDKISYLRSIDGKNELSLYKKFDAGLSKRSSE